MKKPCVAAASVCLLMLQLSGAHVHADETGYIGLPEVSYKHSHGHHDDGDAHHHDAGAEDSGGDRDMRDVSLLDAALSTFKMPLALLAFLILIVAVSTFRRLISTDYIYPILSGRHTRWRPPLRAPPLNA